MPYACLGVDPGMTTGMALLSESGPPLVFQCNASAAYALACFLLEANDGPATVVAAGEAFVAGRGAGARGKDAAVTRQVIADLDQLHENWHWRSAATVKPWSTDARLKAAGLLAPCQGMGHAADGARHGLYAAVHDCGWPDPLSKGAGSFWKR
jgi:hypothetical protein